MNIIESSTNSEAFLQGAVGIVVLDVAIDVDIVGDVVVVVVVDDDVVVVEDVCITITIFLLQHSQVSTGLVPVVQENPSGTIFPSTSQHPHPG